VLKLEWVETVRADLFEIISYISEDNLDAAQRLKNDIEVKASKLPGFPQFYRPGRVAGTREWSSGPTSLSCIRRRFPAFGFFGFCTLPSNGP
jgi:plasmid stabilization system protein ParE